MDQSPVNVLSFQPVSINSRKVNSLNIWLQAVESNAAAIPIIFGIDRANTLDVDNE